MSTPPYGAPAQPPPGWLRFHLQGSMWTSSYVTPSVLINGQLVPARYGENVYPVPPGWTHTVSAQGQWLWTYGQAAQTFTVAPGQVVDIWYAAPLSTWQSGSMGFVKQKRKGVLGLVLVVVAVVAVAVVLAVAGALS